MTAEVGGIVGHAAAHDADVDFDGSGKSIIVLFVSPRLLSETEG